ncbi:hypothetical protein [Streptococcus merionis]|uniref:Phage protein n=1 Tax=Streptococcus merionis TaxID=400065 RepID=A0A239T184_9STRE|nr:hypothetical protein [Streptococcus merionis]QBX08772.1 hypothetical protein JavanS294_0013 [Streptococcus satellite phage Javan294]SNU90583.1 phage protein [Streptococcus merionis]
MTRTPFTQKLLAQIYDANGFIILEDLENSLMGWDIADIKQRLAVWRSRGAISYKLDNETGELTNFKMRNKEIEEKEISEGKRLKLDTYFKQVLATQEIIEKATAKDSDRLKAMELQQKAMNKTPDQVFKELTEIYA